MTSVASFLGQQVFAGGAPGLGDLEKLEGLTSPELTIFSSVDEMKAALSPSVPLFVLPVGTAGGVTVGVHLRPSDVGRARLAFVSVRDEASIIEIAGSPRHLAVLSLLRLEADAEEGGDAAVFESVTRDLRDRLGDDVFQPGAHGSLTLNKAARIAADLFVLTPAAALSRLRLAEGPDEQMRVLEEATRSEPECMLLHARMIPVLHELGDEQRAARAAAAALGCYHHTAYINPQVVYDDARPLLEAVPSAFPETARRDLATTDERERFLWVTELYEGGDVELATKILADMCHERMDYDSVLPIFRKHFERLGWYWALALCDLRQG